MGGLKKPRKKYLEGKPKKIWNRQLLLEELQLMGEYGLRNKKELWLARSKLKWIVRRARSLLSMTA
ncbi:MAG: 30S ribosomal protein S4, partial [Pyrobaculum sp.]